jgi:hypothetical protein
VEEKEGSWAEDAEVSAVSVGKQGPEVAPNEVNVSAADGSDRGLFLILTDPSCESIAWGRSECCEVNSDECDARCGTICHSRTHLRLWPDSLVLGSSRWKHRMRRQSTTTS